VTIQFLNVLFNIEMNDARAFLAFKSVFFCLYIVQRSNITFALVKIMLRLQF